MACSPGCKQGAVFSSGTLLLLGGILAGIFWSNVVDYIFKTELSLTPTSEEYKMWKETPIPMYMDFYFFNWTNAEAVRLGKEKPEVVQCGPYTFSEKHTRVNVTWHDNNDTVTFRQIREWHFIASESNGTLDDEIITPNVIAVTIAHRVKNYNEVIKRMVNVLLKVEESFAVKRTVGELTFYGYRDPLLDLAAELEKVTNISIPMDKFGWFYNRNMSYTYDGIFNMFTGQRDFRNLGYLYTWNNSTRTDYFPGKCGEVKGTTGEIFPSLLGDTQLPVFSTDLCSQIMLTRSNESVELYGIEGTHFFGAKKEFDNGTRYPEYKCYSTNYTIMPSGVRDQSKCHFEAPAYVSYPHFYLADPWYAESVEGLSPNEGDHQFYINVEPVTGIPLSVKARLQINLLLEPIKGMKMFENVPKVMLPVFYFCERATLTETFAEELKILLNLSSIGMYTFYGIAGIGGFIIALGILITVRGYWSSNEDTEILIPDTNNVSKPMSTNGESVR